MKKFFIIISFMAIFNINFIHTNDDKHKLTFINELTANVLVTIITKKPHQTTVTIIVPKGQRRNLDFTGIVKSIITTIPTKTSKVYNSNKTRLHIDSDETFRLVNSSSQDDKYNEVISAKFDDNYNYDDIGFDYDIK